MLGTQATLPKRRLSDANEAGPESQLELTTRGVAALSLQARPKSRGYGTFTSSGGFTSAVYVCLAFVTAESSRSSAFCSVRDVCPWIASDVKKHDSCTFDNMLIYLLGKVHNGPSSSALLEKVLQEVLPVANSQRVRKGLNR